MYTIPEKLKSKTLSDYKRRKITKEIQSYRSIGDVVVYLLALLEREKMTADDETIHSAFHELKKHYPELLKDLTFSRGDIFPFSNELQRSLFNLLNSGIMEAINPVYEVYRIPKRSKKAIISHLSNSFSDSEKEELLHMSEKLQELLSGNASQ